MTFKERYQYNPKTDLIGRGGFSKVFKAKDILLDRDVALKVFTSETSEKYDLINEIKKVIKLDHPNLCRYYDVALLENTTALGEEEKVQVGVMEYMEAGDLREYYRNHKNSLNELLIGVLKGLSFLHKRGIIHRDLKPQNILVTETDEGPVAKITDFGISKAIDSGHTTSSMLLGTIEYMAPEQFSPEKYGINGKISTNLDLWSFGLMVYELVKKENVFGGRSGNASAEQVMSKILLEDYLHKLEDLPEPYRSVTKKCLVKDANIRTANATEIINILISGENVEDTVSNGRTTLLKPLPPKKETPTSFEILPLPKSKQKNLVKPIPIIIAVIGLIILVLLITRMSGSSSDKEMFNSNNNVYPISDSSAITSEPTNNTSDTINAVLYDSAASK